MWACMAAVYANSAAGTCRPMAACEPGASRAGFPSAMERQRPVELLGGARPHAASSAAGGPQRQHM